MTLVREFNLYLTAGRSIPLVINVNQFDSGEQWAFTIYKEDGTQYIPSTGAIVGIKSDNLGIINSGTVDENGRVIITETQQMTAAVGKATFELTIDSGTHGTANFHVLVEPKPGNNADLSESDLSLIQEALNAVSPLPTGGSVGQVLTKTANGSTWSDAGTPTQEQVAEAVSDWADENITVSTGVVIDTSLSVAGAAADAKKTGDEISDLKSHFSKTIELDSQGKIPFYPLTWENKGIDGSGNISDNASRALTAEFIPTMYKVVIDQSVRNYYSWFAYYDENKQFVTRAENGNPSTPTVNTSYAYYKLLLVDYTEQTWVTPINTSYLYADVNIYRDNPSIPHVYHIRKDGTGDYVTLKNGIAAAEQYMDSIVYVGAGTWDLIDELGSDYINSVSSTKRGIYLKNRIHLIFDSNAIVQCNYTGTRADTIAWLSAFNAGEYGFTLENANIQTSNIRYCVHDERDQDTDFYVNKYINCNMYHNSSYAQGGQSQCIGGGLGKNGLIDIADCVFENPLVNNAAIVSYHNSATANAKSNINVHGCYIKGTNTMRFSWYGASTLKTTVKCHDNSVGSAIVARAETEQSTNENIELIAWNNVIRS